jgi:hypothetical protein
MKTLFEQETVDDVISRIDSLQPASVRQWGRMEVAQMMAHCSVVMDMGLGRLNLPRVFIGRLLGPVFKPMCTNDKPFPKNGHAHPRTVISGQRDFLCEQEQLKQKVRQFHDGGEAQCTRHPHPFVGALTPCAWSCVLYKHLDHHLRQFSV